MLNGIYILESDAFDLVYGPEERAVIAGLVRMAAAPQTKQSITRSPELLKNVDVIFSGWGMPVVDDNFLAAAPKLKAVFYAAGAVGSWLTESVGRQGIVVSTAQTANSQPVAEFTLGTILLSLKHTFSLARETRSAKSHPDRNGCPGNYGSVVGLISYGEIARILRDLLRPFDLRVIVFDPFLSPAEATAADITLVDLDEMFATADVVSLHTPLLPETVGMIRGEHFASMKLGATFINTARGPIVREEEMLDVLTRRPDLQAVLDVATVEPPHPKSRMYTLANVLHTPHVAGSAGPECRRMGRHIVDELRRYLRGQPLQAALDMSRIGHTSNRPQANAPGKRIAAGI